MQIDILTLKFVLCIINILNLLVLTVQYFAKKNTGVLYWIAGFGFIALSQLITLNNTTLAYSLSYFYSDLSIIIGFCIVSIGISIFLNESHHIKTDFAITLLIILLVGVLFYFEYLLFEKIFLATIKSIICYKITFNLFFDKDNGTKKSTNFISLLFFIYATVFLVQSVSIIINGVNTNINSPIFIVIYLFSIVIGIISTFGFSYLINQRLATERNKAEEHLKLTQYAMDNTSDAVFLVKQDASIFYINKAACCILGYSYNELINMSVIDIDPNFDKQIWQLHWEELKKRKSMILTSSHIKKSGDIIITEVNANYISFNGHELNCAFVRDITERKIIDEKLKILIEDTLDKNNRLQNFSHIVSHNIRSHAANFSGLLQAFNIAETEEEKEVFIDYLNLSSSKLTETIKNLNEIITFQDHADILYSSVNLFDEIEKTIQSQILDITNSGLLFTNIVDKNINVNVIPAYLDSILLNLITNSIKYKTTNKQPIVNISCNETNEFVEITIKDNGIGIDLKKNGAKLFGMYKTFNGNADAKGVGLFITKNQVEAMKGKIEVESALGLGTTFKISFKKYHE
ncbi:MAG: sensor histidine kinase [Bacteroidia bacterium]